jgi:hypothetical protein
MLPGVKTGSIRSGQPDEGYMLSQR